MAKSTKTKTKKEKGTPNTEGTEPLSNFQTAATGRKDSSLTGKTNGKLKAVTADKIHIEKVKLEKGETLEITYSRIEKDATTTSVSESHKAPVHPDLKNCFKALCIHLGILCDYISFGQVKKIDNYDPKLVEKFNVSGISIKGGDDDAKIVLTGHKLNKSGKAIILNTPYTRVDEDEETGYKFIDNLVTLKDNLIREVQLYLGGKRGEEPQGSLDFPEDTDNKFGDERDDFTAGEAN